MTDTTLIPTTVVGPDGEKHGPFDDVQQAVLHAELLYPGKGQDPDRIAGWDVEPADATS